MTQTQSREIECPVCKEPATVDVRVVVGFQGGKILRIMSQPATFRCPHNHHPDRDVLDALFKHEVNG